MSLLNDIFSRSIRSNGMIGDCPLEEEQADTEGEQPVREERTPDRDPGLSPLVEAYLLEAGFTGIVTDTKGRKIHFMQGKRVKGRLLEVKDDSGHEHDNKGQFTAGSGGGKQSDSTTPTADSPPAKAAPKKFGKSKATVKVAPASSPEKVQATMKKVFGKKAPPVEDMASLVGAPDDATVQVGHDKRDGKDVVTIKIDHPQFEAERYIFKNAAGVHVKNDEFWVKANAQGKGLGADVFGRQVEQCREMGIASIRCHAAKANPRDPSKPHNGYYTWPRFGYDADIEDENFDTPVYRQLKANFPEAETLLEVMATPEGREWWKTNGSDIYHAKFDLEDGSRSMLVHEAYQAERTSKKGS